MESRILKVFFNGKNDADAVQCAFAKTVKRFRKFSIEKKQEYANDGFYLVSNPTIQGIGYFTDMLGVEKLRFENTTFNPWDYEANKAKAEQAKAEKVASGQLKETKAYNPFDNMIEAEPTKEVKKDRNTFVKLGVVDGRVIGYYDNCSVCFYNIIKECKKIIDQTDERNGQPYSITLLNKNANKYKKWLHVFRSEAIFDGFQEFVAMKYAEAVEQGKKKAEQRKQDTYYF